MTGIRPFTGRVSFLLQETQPVKSKVIRAAYAHARGKKAALI